MEYNEINLLGIDMMKKENDALMANAMSITTIFLMFHLMVQQSKSLYSFSKIRLLKEIL